MLTNMHQLRLEKCFLNYQCKKNMIKNKVVKLKIDSEVAKDMPLKKDQEIEIVMDVVYINGHMVPPAVQKTFHNWVTSNPHLFDDVTRNW